MPRSADHTTHGDGDDVDVDWQALPEPVRGRLVDLAASALGGMQQADVPHRLRPVAKFVPAKRARVAASMLLNALSERGTFRAAVVEWARRNRPASLDLGSADAVAATVAAVLLDDTSAAERVDEATRRAEESGLRTERDVALARIQRLEAELDRMRAELAAERDATRRARSERAEELDRLRDRLRERGVELREARQAERRVREELAGAGSASADEFAELRDRLEKERQRADAEHARAQRATADAESARRSAREARQADEVRLALLLDTLDGVADGLRNELAVDNASSRGHRPADTVAGTSNSDRPAAVVGDAGMLDRLLTLPSAHLIVDGYNVTKTGYPELPLAEQRERLARQLSALAARTSVEVTMVFDGAGVVAVPAAGGRGVRVLFSDPGVPADDVIKAIVAAEPTGRPLIVATADREIVDSVRARGAHPVASIVLLDRLGRV